MTKDIQGEAADSKQKILVVDDEASIRRILETRLKMAGYNVVTAEDGEEAVELFNKTNPDIVILDVMMPKMDGYGVTREIRRVSDVPIIILTALGDVSERITGLELGADDYVIKPFSPKELIARIKAVNKRNNDNIDFSGIKINELERSVYIDDEEVELTQTQFDLLLLFLKNINIVFSREKIIESIWGYNYEADDRTIDAHIKLLRSKLGKYKDNIKTVRGVGYKFEVKE